MMTTEILFQVRTDGIAHRTGRVFATRDAAEAALAREVCLRPALAVDSVVVPVRRDAHGFTRVA